MSFLCIDVLCQLGPMHICVTLYIASNSLAEIELQIIQTTPLSGKSNVENKISLRFSWLYNVN